MEDQYATLMAQLDEEEKARDAAIDGLIEAAHSVYDGTSLRVAESLAAIAYLLEALVLAIRFRRD